MSKVFLIIETAARELEHRRLFVLVSLYKGHNIFDITVEDIAEVVNKLSSDALIMSQSENGAATDIVLINQCIS